MNDSEIEDQLRAFKPAAPSTDLAARIERQLAERALARPAAGVIARPARPSSSPWKWLRDLGWAGAGAATALGAVALFTPADKPVMPGPSGAQPPATLAGAPAPMAATLEAQPFEPAEASRELVAVNNSDELIDTA